MDDKVLKVILAILLAPVAVFIQVGATKHLWINLVLLVLTFGTASMVHALWLVLTDQKPS
ncbi:YqaE/Pmp3 family membrane protein [Pelagicoccus sp. SDUM812003]|uniref:YqaE/Pmp3 family membrane protein n=1 Tax=Pelagicoccus sp. SDUM812003 TaxID=3041267 RepID=UPI00280CF345|nr:YqaE/Pmp3 family membrane protein [Pelagicoccus sp. SDUM812003]MDQ8204807.1 YqaE/Pmp3 family membrane protein [Pelagicoccus sp. SDUM812003]